MAPRRARTRTLVLAVALVASVCGCKNLVSDDPANWTPHVLDGQVNSVVQIGDTVYLGGQFTRVREDDDPQELARANFAAFDATSGEILDLAPAFDGQVDVLLPAPDGQSIYVGGWFTTVDGRPSRSLARLSTATGEPVPGFTVPPITGRVRDLRLVGDRLWLAGAFTHVGGVLQPALATIDADTGAFDPHMGLPVTGNHNGGVTQVLKIDVTPDGSRLVAVGNFAQVAGQARRQVAVLDVAGASAQLAPWATTFFTATCASAFEAYLRDLDIAPDGTWMAVTTTGGRGDGPPGPCDTISRFELDVTGTDVRPTWVAYTGGDTSYGVHVSDAAVYVGGHFSWLNNPNSSGAGAVARQGIAALDPANGLPYSWNPGRTLGIGVFDLLETDAGLWVASDTDRIGNYELHGRIAFFPAEGGPTILPDRVGRLPGRVYLLDPASANNGVHGWFFDGATSSPRQTFPNGGVGWDAVRGAVMIGGVVYAGFGDIAGSFVARSFDGETWGPPDPVDTSDAAVVDTAWHADVRNLRGLFYEDGRLYYAVAGSRNLYSRYFTAESQVVGAQRFTASGPVTGLDFADVRSMFVADGHLWWTTSGGDLRRIDWVDGRPVGGTAELVSGPGVDGVDWRARAVLLDTTKRTAP